MTIRSMTSRFTIRPRGPFSLEEAAIFGFGQRIDPTWDGVVRLAFCVDGYRDQVGVEIRQDDLGVHCILHGEAERRARAMNLPRAWWVV
jgi:DNA-3-methyladenine glycosylase II